MPEHPDTDQWIAELEDPKVYLADKVKRGTMQRVASSGAVRAIEPLIIFLYGLAWNGTRKPPEEFLQMMRDFVKSGEAQEAAEAVVAALMNFRGTDPDDYEDIDSLEAFRTWLVMALLELGDASIEPSMRSFSDLHGNTTGYLALALSKFGRGFEQALEIFQTTQDQQILSHMAGALGFWTDKRAIQPLKTYFERICEEANNLPYAGTDRARGRKGALQSLANLGEIDYLCDTMQQISIGQAARWDVLAALSAYLKTHLDDKKVRQTIETARNDSDKGIADYARIILNNPKSNK